MTMLSPHFSLAEMTRSQTAIRRGMKNIPGPNQITNLTRLCEQVLEPIRAHYGKPVIVTSGYRSPQVNGAVGGSATSSHCKGEAVDFTVQGVSNFDVCKWAEANLQYDQTIYEFGESGWVHIGIRASGNRNQELSAKRIGGKTKYLPGIVR